MSGKLRGKLSQFLHLARGLNARKYGVFHNHQWFIDSFHEGSLRGFIVTPHELPSGVNALVSHKLTRELAAVTLPPCRSNPCCGSTLVLCRPEKKFPNIPDQDKKSSSNIPHQNPKERGKCTIPPPRSTPA
jgi:hypothetical protein